MGRGYGGKGSHCPMLLSEIVGDLVCVCVWGGGGHCHNSFSSVFKTTCGTVDFLLCSLGVSNFRKTCKETLHCNDVMCCAF